MPVGPSHNRSGSSGGGGGFSSSHGGGFSSSGSFGGHYSYRPRGPIRINLFGSRIIVSGGRQSALAIIFVFLLFSFIGCTIVASTRNSYLQYLESSKAYMRQCELDAEWYAMAKQKAEDPNNTDPNFFITTATYNGVQKHYYNSYNPTGYYYDSDTAVRVNNIPYFYLIYLYEIPEDLDGDGFNDIIEGETYSSFTSSQAAGWDKKIIVGKDNGSWASINYSYSLSNNMEYQFEKQLVKEYETNLSSIDTAIAVIIIVTVILIVILVLLIIKTIKKGKIDFENEQKKQQAETAEAQAKSEEAQRRAKQINRQCSYCGCSVPDGSDNCPSCGSSKFR